MSSHFAFIESDSERIRHEKNLHLIAEELCIGDEEVRGVYEDELNRFWHVAKVKDFLTVIVGRRVRRLLLTGQGVGAFGAAQIHR